MNDTTFLTIPLIALLLSLFLFLAVLSASNKNRLVVSLITLLGSFVLWSVGSLFMRLGFFPGAMFWYYVSATGIFCVPFLIYYFIHCYTNTKGNFNISLLLIVWTVVVALNLSGVFVTDPQIGLSDGVQAFTYSLTAWAVLPAVLALATILGAIRLAVIGIKRRGIPASSFYPMLFGVAVMFIGLILKAFSGMEWLSSDTLFCAVNSACLYYVLHKKNLVALTRISSNSPWYMLAIVFSTLLCVTLYPRIDEQLIGVLGPYVGNTTIAFALFFTVLTLIIYSILHRLVDMLFTRSLEAREHELKRFSTEISRSLDMSTVIETYSDFLRSNSVSETAYIMTADKSADIFYVAACTRDLVPKTFTLSKNSPLTSWLVSENRTAVYKDFCRSIGYKAMWESEKAAIAKLDVQLVIPIVCDDKLFGMTLITSKNKNRRFTPAEISFLESTSAILTIAFKNATLYEKMENEARHDALTGIYNRSYFLHRINRDFERARNDKLTLVMFSLDDFRLYNELYGTADGDEALKSFARILNTVAERRGTASRYGGKEFMMLLPFTDPRTADVMVSQCRELFSRDMERRGKDRQLTFSAGICGYPTSASSTEELISYTGIAVYSAKSGGKNRTVVYASNISSFGNSTDAQAARKRDLAESCSPMIFALTAAIDAKDHYTFAHSKNVSRYASALAEAISLDAEHIEIIRQAGLLHDIGKIGMPEKILTKSTSLTSEEYEIMKKHVESSISMIRYLPSLDYVIPAAIGHHERWDGRGYPRGISGEQIPIGARCLCLADTFDAMTSKRPYRDAISLEVTLGEIERGLGTQFDPSLGKTFIELVRSGAIRTEQ